MADKLGLPRTATIIGHIRAEARDLPGDVKSVKNEDAGEGTEGFAKFRITL